MAIIRKNELAQMNEKALDDKMVELKKELIKINAQVAIGTVPENPGKIKEIKRTIARIYTLKKIKGGIEKV
jgi:large subunit ribosomal protein L29